MTRSALLWLLLLAMSALGTPRVHAGLPASRAEEPGRSWVLDGCSADSVRRLLESLPAMPLHGIWSATADGADLAVIPGVLPSGSPAPAPAALIVVLRSPRAAFRPGTVCGWLYSTGRPDEYDARIFTSASGASLTEPRKFTVKVVDADHLEIVPRKSRLEFRPLRMLPFMYRIPFVIRQSRQAEPNDGLVRSWPAPSVSPPSPRYL